MDQNQKEIIIHWIKEAWQTIKQYKGEIDIKFITKVSSYDYWIPADKLSEKIIIDAIKESWLDCKIISEESDIIWSDSSEYTVYLDPLDGSINFSRWIPACCIGFAIFKKELPLIGIVYDFNTDELFIAESGKGITLNGKKIVSKTLESNILINLEWFGAEWYEMIVSRLKSNKIRARTAWSWVLALCYGSIWRGDGAILIQNKPWDIAPWIVFASESGYEVKQFNGQAVDLSQISQNIVAAPKNIYEKIKYIFKD